MGECDRARQHLSRLGARHRSSGAGRCGAAAGAEAATRGAADRPLGHRDRALAARSVHDLRQARPAPEAARRGRRGARRRRARHHHSRRDPRFHPTLRREPAGRPGARAHRAWARRILRDSKNFPRRRLSGGHASCVSLAGSAPGRPAGGRPLPRSPPRSAARSRSRSPPALSGCAASPTVSNSMRTAATSSSTTRPARCGPRSRCAPGSHRSSRSRPRCCAKAGSKPSRPARRSPHWPM